MFISTGTVVANLAVFINFTDGASKPTELLSTDGIDISYRQPIKSFKVAGTKLIYVQLYIYRKNNILGEGIVSNV